MLDGVRCQRHAPDTYPRERPSTHCIGAWVELTAGLDGFGIRSPDRPARSEFLYRLTMPVHVLLRNVVMLNDIS